MSRICGLRARRVSEEDAVRTRADARATLALTALGRAEFEPTERARRRPKIADMLADRPDGAVRLLAAMRTIESVLGSVPRRHSYLLREPQPATSMDRAAPRARSTQERGWDSASRPRRKIVAGFVRTSRQAEHCWIARRTGEERRLRRS